MSPKPRRKVKHQTPLKKKHRRERAAPEPNVVVGSELQAKTEKVSVVRKLEAAPDNNVAAMPTGAPEAAKSRFIITELKQVGVLGGGIIIVLVVLALILG